MAREEIRKKVQIHLYRLDSQTGEPRYLVLRRPDSRGGIWQPVTGNVDAGENLPVCARRELQEETGLEELSSIREVHRFRFEKDGRVFEETVYVAECPRGEVQLSSEHIDCAWLPYEEARTRIHFDSNQRALDLAHRAVTSISRQENQSR